MRISKRACLALAVAAVPAVATVATASAEIDNPGISVGGVGGQPCVQVAAGTIQIDGSNGLVFVNGGGVTIFSLTQCGI